MAVVEPRNDLLLMKLSGHSGHWTPMEVLRGEMLEAHYRPRDSFDFLPLQHFVVFEPEKVKVGAVPTACAETSNLAAVGLSIQPRILSWEVGKETV